MAAILKSFPNLAVWFDCDASYIIHDIKQCWQRWNSNDIEQFNSCVIIFSSNDFKDRHYIFSMISGTKSSSYWVYSRRVNYGVDTLIVAMKPMCFSQGFSAHDMDRKKTCRKEGYYKCMRKTTSTYLAQTTGQFHLRRRSAYRINIRDFTHVSESYLIAPLAAVSFFPAHDVVLSKASWKAAHICIYDTDFIRLYRPNIEVTLLTYTDLWYLTGIWKRS